MKVAGVRGSRRSSRAACAIGEEVKSVAVSSLVIRKGSRPFEFGNLATTTSGVQAVIRDFLDPCESDLRTCEEMVCALLVTLAEHLLLDYRETDTRKGKLNEIKNSIILFYESKKENATSTNKL